MKSKNIIDKKRIKKSPGGPKRSRKWHSICVLNGMVRISQDD